VCAAATSGEYGSKEVTIRVNSIGTPWHDDDLRAVAEAGPAAVVVPKINSAADVAAVEQALVAAGASEDLKIWAMVETPVAMLRAEEIATSSDRLVTLVMGTNDLAKELHAKHVPGRLPLLGGLQLCLLAARAAGKVILDGVYNDVRNPEGFEEECRQGVELGFDGKTLIHPTQVEPTNRLFAPSEDEIEQARKIIEAFEKAEAEGRGVVTVDGRMIENLHVDEARRNLAIAERIAATV
jgi:citrate lyase subunit beta/citryl-CoA lyase